MTKWSRCTYDRNTITSEKFRKRPPLAFFFLRNVNNNKTRPCDGWSPSLDAAAETEMIVSPLWEWLTVYSECLSGANLALYFSALQPSQDTWTPVWAARRWLHVPPMTVMWVHSMKCASCHAKYGLKLACSSALPRIFRTQIPMNSTANKLTSQISMMTTVIWGCDQRFTWAGSTVHSQPMRSMF